jgi:hypothetical protein
MFELLNRDRATEGQGLPPLQYDSALADVARAHSHDMNELGFFAHESERTGKLDDRLDRASLVVLAARENLGLGPRIETVQQGLMQSPGHRTNILSTDVTHVGVGVVRVLVQGSEHLLVTQVFATPVPHRDQAHAGELLTQRILAARHEAGLSRLPFVPALTRQAQKYVTLVDDRDPNTLSIAASEIERDLGPTSFQGLFLSASVMLSPHQYQPSPHVLDPQARALGLATTAERDARGRPAIKLLVLIGR